MCCRAVDHLELWSKVRHLFFTAHPTRRFGFSVMRFADVFRECIARTTVVQCEPRGLSRSFPVSSRSVSFCTIVYVFWGGRGRFVGVEGSRGSSTVCDDRHTHLTWLLWYSTLSLFFMLRSSSSVLLYMSCVLRGCNLPRQRKTNSFESLLSLLLLCMLFLACQLRTR